MLTSILNGKKPNALTTPITVLALLSSLILTGLSCKKNNNNNPQTPTLPWNFQQVNLASDTAAFNPLNIDANLTNAWGLAINPKGIFWLASNGTGLATVYDSTGKTLFGPIDIPFRNNPAGSAPSGAIFNTTPDFTIPGSNRQSLFIYSTENGTITAWAPGLDTFATVVDNSASNAVYKGIAWASNNGANFIYATDFHNGKIDVFDKNFNPVSLAFSDGNIPLGPGNYGPFNIQNIGGELFVTYAKLSGPADHDDLPGPGNGYVDVFTPGGTLVRRFVSNGQLNSPWGLAQAPAGSGLPFHSVLVGNFGDGRINVYDSTGTYLGVVQSNGKPLIIAGLWAVAFATDAIPSASPSKLYFTSGPFYESHGLFGYLHAQ